MSKEDLTRYYNWLIDSQQWDNAKIVKFAIEEITRLNARMLELAGERDAWEAAAQFQYKRVKELEKEDKE